MDCVVNRRDECRKPRGPRPAGKLALALLLPWMPGAAASLAAQPAAAAAPASPASAENRHVWEPKTKSVAVFKNGLGFFTREGRAELRDGWCYARDVPPAAFGTLAIYAQRDRQAVDVVGSGPGEIVAFDGADAPRDIDTKRARLEAAIGLNVALQYDQQAADRSAAGKLLSIGPDYAVLDAEEHTVAVPLEGITQLQVLDLPLRVHVVEGEEESPATEAELGVAYLRKGIMWVPEYTLEVIDDETAELTLRGTLVNEAEDLVHCDVNFVVGVPHFVHSELMSPIAVGRVIRTLGASLPSGSVPPQVMSQMMNRAAIANNANTASQFDGSFGPVDVPAPDDSGDLSDVLGNLPQLEGAATGDYTVYTRRDLTVRRGERAIVTLFTKKIRYRHRYRWELPGPVKHFLALENATSTAWTTGPCLTLSDGRPLSEDVLRYTPRGGTGELQVTTAINVAHDHSEAEVERETKAHEPRHNEFLDLVTIEGNIRLKSFEADPVEIVIRTPIQGRPLEADHDGVLRTDASELRLVERSGTITWRLTLDPGEEKTLTYRYERYVPSR